MIEFILEILTYEAQGVIIAPFPWMAAATIGSALLGARSAAKGRKMAASQSAANLERQKEMDAKLDVEMDAYRAMEFSNPYENLRNEFSGMSNQFDGMENTMEDLTVNTQAADYATQTFNQNQSNVLQGLRGAAGTSGAAGLAQTLANAGLQQSQQMAGAIGQQEAANKRMAAQESSKIQGMRLGEDSRIQQLQMTESARIQMARAGGEGAKEQGERDRQATLLGMAQGMAAGANANLQQGYSNQMAAQSANTQALYGVAGAAIESGGLDKMGDLFKGSSYK